MARSLTLGTRVTFINRAHYPSLTGTQGTIKDVPDHDYDFFSVKLDTGVRMACHSFELIPERPASQT